MFRDATGKLLAKPLNYHVASGTSEVAWHPVEAQLLFLKGIIIYKPDITGRSEHKYKTGKIVQF